MQLHNVNSKLMVLLGEHLVHAHIHFSLRHPLTVVNPYFILTLLEQVDLIAAEPFTSSQVQEKTMNNNDVLRSIRHILNLSDTSIVDIFKLAHHTIDQATVCRFLAEEDESGYQACSDNLLTLFLDGLISRRRGKSEDSQNTGNKIFPPLTNNSIFKKLRIAFDLKEDDLIELMSLAEYDTSKNELSAIFRKPGHKHYRECPDEFLMGFLVGLTFRDWS